MVEQNLPARPGRSNSLQRMLELEKHFMRERLQALSPNDSITTHHSQFPAARPNIRAQRPDLTPQNASRPSSRSPRRDSFSTQKPPIVTHMDSAKTSLTSTDDQYASLAIMIDDFHAPDAVAALDKPSPKVVAFQFPPDCEERKSVCQSPTWEAYDRRKQERKDEKREEKRREEERKEKKREEEERKKEALKTEQQNVPRKPRRLSKPPPVSPQTQEQIKAASTTALPTPRTQRARPVSVLGLTFPSFDDGPERSPRKRSGSFSSLIRAPFEARRASFDHTNDAGFIGGIKLEQERYDAQQRADEANIHPALRKSKANSRSSSPLRSPHAPSARGGGESAQRRAYPPITILTASSKTRSLAGPDATRMDKLRARVGLKTTAKNDKTDGQVNNGIASETRSTTASNTSSLYYESDMEKTLTNQSKESIAPKSPGLTPEPLRLRTDKTGAGRRTLNEKSLNIRIPHKDEGRSPDISVKSSPMTPMEHTATKSKESEPTLSDLMAQEKLDKEDAALLLPPLRPPRKSSKRALATNSSATSPATATPRVQVAPSPSASSDIPQNFFKFFDGTYTPPSLELNVPEDKRPAVAPKPRVSEDSPRFINHDAVANSLGITPEPTRAVPRSSLTELSQRSSTERKPRDAARSSLGRLVTSQMDNSRSTKQEKPNDKRQAREKATCNRTLGSMIISGRPLSSSSEDSSADELQFHSPLSTPGTSRPQSEKELTPVPTDNELGPTLGERRKSTHLERQVAQEDLPPLPAYSRHHQRKSSHLSDIDNAIELDRIQAAARKVMAAFPGAAAPQRSSVDRRTQSDPDVAASAGFLPKLKLRKDKSKLGQVTSPLDLEKGSTARGKLLGATSKAKSAVHLPQTTKSQPTLSSPGFSSMSLPTATSHHLPPSAASSPEVASKPLLSRTSRPSMDGHRGAGADSTHAPVAKMFVECCGCKYYHDMPSRLYETMVSAEAAMSPADALAFRGSKAMTVRCPWCRHDMSTKCCAGLAAMMYVKERLH